MIISMNLREIDPWFGLMKKSPVISLVGHHSTDIYPFLILSITKKRMLMCFVILPLYALPLFFKIIELLLSWKMMLSVKPWSRAFKKFIVPKIPGINSSTPTTSDSVDLQVFSFCFVEADIGKHITIERPPP